MKRRVLQDLQAAVWTPKGHERVWYKVELDETDLEDMARRAAAGKRGVAKMGALTVTITNRERVR